MGGSPDRIGRYRIERPLGDTPTGVVYTAYDPESARDVAIELVRVADRQLRERVLRDARTLARLRHPGLATVHEVGEEPDPFVVRELVDGVSLDDWLQAAEPSRAAIVAAFVQIGRALGTAHAAGLVHRTFTPRTVRRTDAGRFVVTDFGIARGGSTAPATLAPPTLAGGPRARARGERSEPQERSEPAGRDELTAAGDQHAFCAALWRALVWRAGTEAKIPTRLRRVLERGLDPDPAARWPSMEALVDALPEPISRIALAVGGVGIAVVASLAVALGSHQSASDAPAPLPGCPPPVVDPAALAVATPDRYLNPERASEAAAIHDELLVWRRARDHACGLEPAARAPILRCLDGVLVRLDAVAGGVAALPFNLGGGVDPREWLIDPALCEPGKRMPALATSASRELREVIGVAIDMTARPWPGSHADLSELAVRVASDPCAAALANTLVAEAAAGSDREGPIAKATEAAMRCDDRVQAEVALDVARFAFEDRRPHAELEALFQRAADAIERVAQPDLEGKLELLGVIRARRDGQVDLAIARGEAAMRGFAARERLALRVFTGLAVVNLLARRATGDDAARAGRMLGELRARAVERVADRELVDRIDAELEMREFLAGDVVRASLRLFELHRTVYKPGRARKTIHGRVLIEGKPATHAVVAVGPALVGSAATAALATPDTAPGLRYEWTDDDGRFTVRDAPGDGLVIAEDRTPGRGRELRSLPVPIADDLTLVLEPLSRIDGRVELRGATEPGPFVVVVRDPARAYELIAPIAPDGTFSVAVSRGRWRAYAIREAARRSGFHPGGIAIDTRAGAARGVSLAVTRVE